jgi:hypothetical protein
LPHQRLDVRQLAAHPTGTAELADELAEVRQALGAAPEQLLEHRPHVAEVIVLVIVVVVIVEGIRARRLP